MKIKIFNCTIQLKTMSNDEHCDLHRWFSQHFPKKNNIKYDEPEEEGLAPTQLLTHTRIS